MIRIENFQSLLITSFDKNNNPVLNGTVFIIKPHDKYYLILSKHVALNYNDKIGTALNSKNPNKSSKISVRFNLKSDGRYEDVILNLYTIDDKPLYTQVKVGPEVDSDVLALPLDVSALDKDIKIIPVDYSQEQEIGLMDHLVIVGYPAGRPSWSNNLPLWKTAFVASEVDKIPGIDNPLIHVDNATLMGGISGAPVYYPKKSFKHSSQSSEQYVFAGIFFGGTPMQYIGDCYNNKYLKPGFNSLP